MNLLPFLFSGPLCSPAGEDLLCKEPYLLRNNPDSVPPLLRIYQWFPQSSGSDLNSTPTMGNIWSFLYSSFISKKKKKKNQPNSSHAFMRPGLFIFSSNSCFLSTFCVLIPVLGARVVMYRCESWTIKKAEHQRIDAFKLSFWRRFLRVPWTARRSNQSILKEIRPEYSLEGRVLKLQYFGHLMGRTYSLEKTLMLGKMEGRRRRG